jgi:phosphoribosylformylglycinamidine synthase
MVASVHDLSDGGALAAAAEMCIGSGLGMAVAVQSGNDPELFAERPGRYLVEVTPEQFGRATEFFAGQPVRFDPFGRVLADPKLVVGEPARLAAELSVEEMTRAWRGTLDW